MRSQRFSTLLAVVTGCVLLASPASARDSDPDGALGQVPLPGGVRAALDAMGDHGAADRSDFLLDVIRRHHAAPRGPNARPDPVLAALVAHLERSAAKAPSAGPIETVPLALDADVWLEIVLPGRATADTLVSAILQSRGAALLYHGLLSLDDETRAWIATHPDLIAEIAASSAGAFVIAAPGLRVSDGALRLPGGTVARPVWEALVGRPLDDPASFVRGMLAPRQARLAYFIAAMAQLTPPQIALAMGLDSADPSRRIAAAQRLLAVFDRLGWDWRVEQRPFWRPTLDPALLVAELSTGDDGRPWLPGTDAFWQLAFADSRRGLSRPTSEANARASGAGAPVDFVSLCELVFERSATHEARYQLVLFASRVVPHVTPGTAREAIDAVRAAAAYPSLTAALERAGVVDVAVFASAGRRAAGLSAIRDRASAHRALAQFQGTLAILTRSAARGTLPKDALARAVLSVAALETNARGDYEGRLVRWLDAHLQDAAGSASLSDGSMESRLMRALAGAESRGARVIDWEGTRYRLDLAHAEVFRMSELLGRDARPYLSSAVGVVGIADALAAAEGVETLHRAAAEMESIAEAVIGRIRRPRVLDDVQRRTRERDVRGAARLAPDLQTFADDLLGRGLMEFAYAAAMGQPERALISAGEAASRHDFGLAVRSWRHNAAWQPPMERVDAAHGWRVDGSLLGLDVRLAPFSLVQLSSKPPSRSPTLNDQDRRLLSETVVLLEPVSLADADRDTLVTAMQKGRAKLEALRTRSDALTAGDEIRLSAARRSLLAWVVAHDRESVTRFLSPGELLWLGLDGTPVAAELHAWGAPGRPRLGCQCLRLVDRRPWEMFAGRWHSGILVSAFPDLNLRLAELLAELQMPAPLLGPVLAPALLDFVNLVVSRDPDDRRGLVDFVQALRIDQVEQYLSALTTDGPLVPIGRTPPQAAGSGVVELEVP